MGHSRLSFLSTPLHSTSHSAPSTSSHTLHPSQSAQLEMSTHTRTAVLPVTVVMFFPASIRLTPVTGACHAQESLHWRLLQNELPVLVRSAPCSHGRPSSVGGPGRRRQHRDAERVREVPFRDRPRFEAEAWSELSADLGGPAFSHHAQRPSRYSGCVQGTDADADPPTTMPEGSVCSLHTASRGVRVSVV